MQAANLIRQWFWVIGFIWGCLVLFSDIKAFGNTTVFFSASNGTAGRQLWKTDGSSAGTVMVKDIFPLGDADPDKLTNVNGILYFVSTDGTNGRELWKSDGSSAGTIMLKNINPNVNDSSDPNNLTLVNGILYFTATDGSNGSLGQHGRELWKTNGTSAGTVMVKDINLNGASDSDPQQLTNVNGILYFTATDGSNGSLGQHGRELWKTDGTSAGTVMVKDINLNGASDSDPQQLTNVNGILYFTATDGSNGSLGQHGRELWKTNGTSAGTVMVKDINLNGAADSDPQQLTLAFSISGDFDSDGNVDITDLGIFCGNWLTNNKLIDIAPEGGDGIVNMKDFAVFAESWLTGD